MASKPAPTPSFPTTAKKKRKTRKRKSKPATYWPKIEVDTVFKPVSAKKPAARARARKKTRGRRKTKERSSLATGVSPIQSSEVGAGLELMKKVEIEAEMEKKVEDDLAMGGDATPPPKRLHFLKTYARRRGSRVQRRLNFGAEEIKKDLVEVSTVLEQMVEEEKDQPSDLATIVNPVAIVRKARSTRARNSVKRIGGAIAAEDPSHGQLYVQLLFPSTSQLPEPHGAIFSVKRNEGTPLAQEFYQEPLFALAADHQLLLPSTSLPPEPHDAIFSVKRVGAASSAEESSHGQPDHQLILPCASLPPEPRDAIVLFQESARLMEPEVLFDDVSEIMWKLTVHEGSADMDAETEERCRKEWEKFDVLVQKFITGTRSILGHRRYSKWKGSVVDSVVGAYLTQNVTDTMSSQAFMCLSSRYHPEQATNDSNTHPCKEVECVKLNLEEAIENVTEPCSEVCSTVHDPVEIETQEVYGKIHELEKKFQNSSIRDSENLELKTSRSINRAVSGGQTAVHEQKVKKKSAEGKTSHTKNMESDWELLRREICSKYYNHQRTFETLDSVDYTALRTANVEEIAATIKVRGMNNKLAARIKGFLNKLWDLHGCIDLEWLRLAPEDKVKEYLLHFKGLGLKSVECIRLLSLRHQAFPVDTNVARISVRLGWVPLRPLPQFMEIHGLKKYPHMNEIQRYLWPRLRKFDNETLYELHCLLITFAKVLCTKSRPNCQACPLKRDCQHYASACAREKLPLFSSERKHQSSRKGRKPRSKTKLMSFDEDQSVSKIRPNCQACDSKKHCQSYESACARQENSLLNSERHAQPSSKEKDPSSQNGHKVLFNTISLGTNFNEDSFGSSVREPVPLNVVFPDEDADELIGGSSEYVEIVENVIGLQQRDTSNSPDNCILGDIEDLAWTVGTCSNESMAESKDSNVSYSMVPLTFEAASTPVRKLKKVARLRTEHYVYELPDDHPLLANWRSEPRIAADSNPYLLSIWLPGETAESYGISMEPCSIHESGGLCNKETCFACNNVREGKSQFVRGTILIPCRTATRGSFPLNGTYFQLNEVFADEETSRQPINVPTNWLWHLRRLTVHFGSTVTMITRGLSLEEAQELFSGGYMCLRGFERSTRSPTTLRPRFHCPRSKIKPVKPMKSSENDNRRKRPVFANTVFAILRVGFTVT